MKKNLLSLVISLLLFAPNSLADTVVASSDKVDVPVQEGKLQIETASIEKDKETGTVFSVWNFTYPKSAQKDKLDHIRMLTASDCVNSTITIVAGIAFDKKDKVLGLVPQSEPIDIHKSFIFEAVQGYTCNVSSAPASTK